MPIDATRAALIEVVDRHVRAEVAQDVDGVMATICAQPHYEVQPLGLVMTSTAAVREFYQRLLYMMGEKIPADPGKVATSDADDLDSSIFLTTGDYMIGQSGGQAGLVLRDRWRVQKPTGIEYHKSLALFLLDEKSRLLKGEHIYLNAGSAAVFKQALGEEFANLPGVTLER
ncbi:MAG: hypothetical protein ABW110_12375 [Steroidobacteraceae bacterium]